MSPILITLLLTILSYLLNTAFPTLLSDLTWSLLTTLSPNNKLKTQRTLKLEVLRLRNTIRGTSAQDQFAKWAKAKRQHDQKMAELEKLNSEIQSLRLKHTASLRLIRWILTSGLLLLLQIYHLRTPTFYLPAGLVPGPVEWLLAFPKAPPGSVSVQAWSWACAVAVNLILGKVMIGGVRAVVAMGGNGVEKGEKVAVPVAAGGEKEL